MAGFADVAPAPFNALHPMIERNISGVEAIVDHQRGALFPKFLLDPLNGRREAPVEPDHQPGRIGDRLDGLAYGVEIRPTGRQRLFDKDMLAGLERANHLAGVLVMPCGDDHQVEAIVFEDSVIARGQQFDLFRAREIAAARRVATHHAAQEKTILAALHHRHEHLGAKSPGADESIVDPLPCRRPVPPQLNDARVGLIHNGPLDVGIGDQHTQRRGASARLGELRIGRRSVSSIETTRSISAAMSMRFSAIRSR